MVFSLMMFSGGNGMGQGLLQPVVLAPVYLSARWRFLNIPSAGRLIVPHVLRTPYADVESSRTLISLNTRPSGGGDEREPLPQRAMARQVDAAAGTLVSNDRSAARRWVAV
jgi:hypothetical protein